MADIVEDADANLTRRMRTLLDRLWVEWRQLDYDIETASEDIERIAGEDEACQRLRQIPGVDPLVSTATVAAIGNGAAFRKGREFAAWLGLVPRQHTTGGKTKLLGISKRGNSYLRRMFIHGCPGRATQGEVRYRQLRPVGASVGSASATQQSDRRGANKLARVAWAARFNRVPYHYETSVGSHKERPWN
jgi:transposase